ncbi:ATP-binding cassette domain-containing protein [Cryobacterium flavum]
MTFVPPHPERDDESVANRAAESTAPLAAKPLASKPAMRKPAVRKPAVRKPAVREPAVRTTATTRPAAARPAVAKPTADKPAAVKPAAKPAVTKAATVRPAAGVRQPAARKPAVRKPAVRKPTVSTSTTPKKPTTPKSPAVAGSVRPNQQTLAENSTDETTRPYATRDALVTIEAEASLATPVAPLPEPTSDPAVQTTPTTDTLSTAAQPAVKSVSPRDVKPTVKPAADATSIVQAPIVIEAVGLVKRYGHNVAVSDLDLSVRAGSFYGIVGPNGAGKTTTLSMITGLLRPTAGKVLVHGIDVWARPNEAKRVMGVLPDRLRLFDRLTGAQLLYYAGTLRGLDNDTVRARSADLAAAFGLEDALNRLVADYSAGMTKKIALACAMIHSPRVLVLDEPFESVDPVSAVNVTEILQKYVAAGGTVVLSSHGMDLIQRVCDHVAIIVQGRVLAAGTVDEVRGEKTLEDRFVELAGGRKVAEGMEWLHNFSD